MSVAGIIFSNLHDSNVSELTRRRTMASIPFVCRYRLIDFALSNMVNSGISNINVITHNNYHSLMEHIGSGKDWDLARRSGGIKILPPYITAYANNVNGLYNSRLEALQSVNYSISRFTEDYVVLSDCDNICNINLQDIINEHIANNADITLAVKKMYLNSTAASKNVIIESDSENKLTDIYIKPQNITGDRDINLNIMVVSRVFLQNFVYDSISHSYDSFTRDIIARNIGKYRFFVYHFNDYFANIKSFADYFSCTMDIAKNQKHRDALFSVKNRPIYTRVRNSPPTKYIGQSIVENSLIADGCVIEGTVRNSVLFRGVKVGRGSVVENSILFTDTDIGERASLNCVVADKGSSIREGRRLSGHETLPFYIDKGIIV